MILIKIWFSITDLNILSAKEAKISGSSYVQDQVIDVWILQKYAVMRQARRSSHIHF